MKQFNLVWLIWLALVILWNYGFPNVDPIADVAAAVILSIGSYQLIKKMKK